MKISFVFDPKPLPDSLKEANKLMRRYKKFRKISDDELIDCLGELQVELKLYTEGRSVDIEFKNWDNQGNPDDGTFISEIDYSDTLLKIFLNLDRLKPK